MTDLTVDSAIGLRAGGCLGVVAAEGVVDGLRRWTFVDGYLTVIDVY